ncbi:hypothetical protein F5B19DRAFT_496647 [Rostrohypoxylon terebratum]|nr:hypothetical protein F5B19DRAFT_496647 [Rostrohypoxylon terebratum]
MAEITPEGEDAEPTSPKSSRRSTPSGSPTLETSKGTTSKDTTARNADSQDNPAADKNIAKNQTAGPVRSRSAYNNRSRRAGRPRQSRKPPANADTIKPQESQLSPHAPSFVPLSASGGTSKKHEGHTTSGSGIPPIPAALHYNYHAPVPWFPHRPHPISFTPYPPAFPVPPPMLYQPAYPGFPVHGRGRQQGRGHSQRDSGVSVTPSRSRHTHHPRNYTVSQSGIMPPPGVVSSVNALIPPQETSPAGPSDNIPCPTQDARLRPRKVCRLPTPPPPPPPPKKLTEEEERAERIRIFREQFERGRSFDDDDEFMPGPK